MSRIFQRREVYGLLIGFAIAALICDLFGVDLRGVNKIIRNIYIVVSAGIFVGMIFLFIKETFIVSTSFINKLAHIVVFLALDILILFWFIGLSGILDTNIDY